MDNFIFENLPHLFKEMNNDVLKQSIPKLVNHIILNIENFPFHYHPLGFIYSKLYTLKNNETIRLHIWDNERRQQKPLMDCHDHFYIVNSFVICGEIFNILYEDTPTEIRKQVIYEGDYSVNGDRYLIKTNNFVNYIVSKIEVINAGQVYSIQKNNFIPVLSMRVYLLAL